MFNSTLGTKPLKGSLIVDPESKNLKKAFGQTQVRFKDLEIDDKVTGDENNSTTYKLEEDLD